MSFRRTVSAAFALFAVAAASCGCAKRDDSVVLVGAFFSLSGADSSFGADSRAGIDLAVEETNAHGGVLNKRVKVRFEDDKSMTMEASQKVRQLIDRDKVVAILGEVASSRSLAGGLIANTRRIPMVSPSSTAVQVTKGRPWVFRTCFTDDDQGTAVARFVRNSLHKKRIGIFFAAQDTYSTGLARSFRAELSRLGGDIVVDKGYQKGETNYRTYLTELKGANPEVIFVPNYYSEMVLIARQAREVGLPGSIFFGGDGWDAADLVEGAGEELEGAYFTNHYAPDVPWPTSRAFVDAFRAKYKRDPSSLTAQAYDAAHLLFSAIERSRDASPDAIRGALADTKNYQGATGLMSINAERNAKKPVVIVQVKNRKFTYADQLMVE